MACTKYRPAAEREKRFFPKDEPTIITEPHQKPKNRAEVEKGTSSNTLYGVCKSNPNPPNRWPKTYASEDWSSVTKSDYPGFVSEGALSKELQIERANTMRQSAVTIGDRSKKPERHTQHMSFKPHDRSQYTEKKCFPIGGRFNKVRSDVEITGDDALPRQYEPMSKRQFQPHPMDKSQVSKMVENQTKNKLDMNSSHFVIGQDAVDYRTVAKSELVTAPPNIKNRPPSAADKDKNPFIAQDANDCRPRVLSAKEISSNKLTSNIPLQFSNVSTLRETTTGGAFPKFRAVRQGIVTTTNTGVSSLQFGTDVPEYKPATATQFRGIYFKPDQKK